MGFGIWDLGFRVRFKVNGLGFRPRGGGGRRVSSSQPREPNLQEGVRKKIFSSAFRVEGVGLGLRALNEGTLTSLD